MTDVAILYSDLALSRIVLFVLGKDLLGANFTVSHRPRGTSHEAWLCYALCGWFHTTGTAG